MIEASEEMKENGIALDIRNTAEDATIQGESHLLVSCLVNMLRNAVEHCDPGGSITIMTVKTEESIVCEVIDQGKNYSEELFEDLSNQFSLVETRLNLNLGIELGLAQMIMEAHGGKIFFGKTNDNNGSVQMIFPLTLRFETDSKVP